MFLCGPESGYLMQLVQDQSTLLVCFYNVDYRSLTVSRDFNIIYHLLVTIAGKEAPVNLRGNTTPNLGKAAVSRQQLFTF